MELSRTEGPHDPSSFAGHSEERPKILVLLNCFRRGHEATGPNQSMIGMAQVLESQFHFRFIAEEPNPQIRGWADLAGVEHLTLPRGPLGAIGLRETLLATPHDLLILNSIFDPQLTIPTLTMRRLGLIPRKPALLAPRGEFSPGTLALKATKKQSYLTVANRLGLFRNLAFQATSDEEARRIASRLPKVGPIFIGPNVRVFPPLPPHVPRAAKQPLRVAFLGRINPVKNLDFALEVLAQVNRPVRLDIYGWPEEPNYWRRCQSLMAHLPQHIEVPEPELVSQADVLPVLAAHDLLFLPTRGENFGHSIFESLAAGTPVLISDQTPWRNLQSHSAGWDLPLNQPAQFTQAIQQCTDMTPEDRDRIRFGARALAERTLSPAIAGAELAQCLYDAMAFDDRDRPAGAASGAKQI